MKSVTFAFTLLVLCAITSLYPVKGQLCTVHGCDFNTATAFANNVTINFPAQGALAYDPKCVKIPVGAFVKFSGSFSLHPLRGGTTPVSIFHIFK
jgi:hypothetical protein